MNWGDNLLKVIINVLSYGDNALSKCALSQYNKTDNSSFDRSANSNLCNLSVFLLPSVATHF